jgi:hypothetical protein
MQLIARIDVLSDTENRDPIILLSEDFAGIWPPQGWDVTTTGVNINWEQSNTNHAGGEEPEAMFFFSPATVATQRLITPPLDTTEYLEISIEFRQLNNDLLGDYTLALQTSTDGENWTTIQSFAATDFGPQQDNIITQTNVGAETLYIAWMFDGDSYNLNHWCIDDVVISATEMIPPLPINLHVDTNSGLFTWDEPEHSGMELLHYAVYLDDDFVETSQGTGYILENLVNGESYTAGVSAVYDIGESEIAELEFTYEGVSADDPLVSATKLIGNYPNPFNPETNISFSLAAGSRVKIEIFNIHGQKVQTLVNSEYPAGHHNVVWDGRDNKGQQVGSGVFFYQMKTEEYVEVKRMVLLK